MVKIAMIAAGGAVGATLRYLISGYAQRQTDSLFPVGTLFVNVIGCLIIGLLGALFVLLLFVVLVLRLLRIARLALEAGRPFAGYLVYGVAFLLGVQCLINLGVNTGMLPTKGLTLPFVSYGGNSLIVCCAMLGLVCRVELEGADG